MDAYKLEEDFKRKLRRCFPNMDGYVMLVENNVARLQFMNYTISTGLSGIHNPKTLLFTRAAEMVDLLYRASRKRVYAEDQKRHSEFRESCIRQQINRTQSATVEDKVSFMREEKNSFKKLKACYNDPRAADSSHISNQEVNSSVSDAPTGSFDANTNQDLCALSSETDGFTVRSLSSENAFSELTNPCTDESLVKWSSDTNAMHCSDILASNQISVVDKSSLLRTCKAPQKHEPCSNRFGVAGHEAKECNCTPEQPIQSTSGENVLSVNGLAQKQGARTTEKNPSREDPGVLSQKDIPDTSYMKKAIADNQDQSHGFISVVRSFCTHYRILPPEFEIVRENDVFRCTAIFLGINFVSSYEYDKLDSKNDSCKKVVEYIVRNWKSVFQYEQYSFQ